MSTLNILKRIDEEIIQSLERELSSHRDGDRQIALEEMGIQNGLSMAKAIIQEDDLLLNNKINNEEE